MQETNLTVHIAPPTKLKEKYRIKKFQFYIFFNPYMLFKKVFLFEVIQQSFSFDFGILIYVLAINFSFTPCRIFC